MQNAVKHIQAVVSRILFIGLSVQIVLGLLWMCCSLDGVQEFRASGYYLAAADSLLCDEYTGILYPFILMLVKGLDGALGIPYEPVLYLLQIALAVVAGYCFVASAGVKGKLWKIWGSLVLLTFPMTMQCHMAILPNSFAYSCFLLLLAGVGKRVRPFVCWILAALLMSEYLYLGAVPVVLGVIYCLVGNRCRAGKEQHTGFAVKRLLCRFALIIASVAIIGGINTVSLEPGSHGRVHNSAEAAAFRRCCWTDFSSTYYYWPEELRAAVSDDLIAEIVKEAENLDAFFMPKVEEVLGVEEARAWFGMVAKELFVKNYRLTLYEMAIDVVGYTMPTVVADLLFGGRDYSSYCMRNYEIMRQDHPLLVRYYMNYSIWWFYVGCVMTAGMLIVRKPAALLCGRQQKKAACDIRKVEEVGHADAMMMHIGFWTVICIVSAGAMVLWHTVQDTGLWDYKKALFVGGLWMLWMIKGAYTGAQEK